MRRASRCLSRSDPSGLPGYGHSGRSTSPRGTNRFLLLLSTFPRFACAMRRARTATRLDSPLQRGTYRLAASRLGGLLRPASGDSTRVRMPPAIRPYLLTFQWSSLARFSPSDISVRPYRGVRASPPQLVVIGAVARRPRGKRLTESATRYCVRGHPTLHMAERL